MLEVGDIILTRSPSLLARLIALFSTEPGEEHAFWTHAAMVVWPGDITHAKAIEALSPRVRVAPAWWVVRDKSFVVWRRFDLSPTEAGHLKSTAMQDLGRRYPIPKLILHFLDWTMERITGRDWGFFSRMGRWGKRKECSVLVAYSWWGLGEHFGKKSPEEVKPGDINDSNASSPAWVRVAEVLQ